MLFRSVVGVRSLIPTISILGLLRAARKKFRPIRPKPLIPTFTDMVRRTFQIKNPAGLDTDISTTLGYGATLSKLPVQPNKSGESPASVSGIPSSEARLSAIASNLRIRPAIASFVIGGEAKDPNSSNDA